MQFIASRPLLSFLVLTWLLSWPFWIASGVLGRGASLYDFHWLIALIGVFGPSLAALIVSATLKPELRKNSARIALLFVPVLLIGILIATRKPSTRFDAGMLATFLAILLAAAVLLFFSPLNRRLLMPTTGERFEKPRAAWLAASLLIFPVLFLLAWWLVNVESQQWTLSTHPASFGQLGWMVIVAFAMNLSYGGTLGEEIGWRGFALPELLKTHSPFSASIVLGLIWALWHAPIDLTSGFLVHGPGAIVARIAWILPLTIVFTWFTLQSKCSLLSPFFLHTSVNILSEFGFSRYEGALVMFFALNLIVAILLSCFRTMHKKRP